MARGEGERVAAVVPWMAVRLCAARLALVGEDKGDVLRALVLSYLLTDRRVGEVDATSIRGKCVVDVTFQNLARAVNIYYLSKYRSNSPICYESMCTPPESSSRSRKGTECPLFVVPRTHSIMA